MDAVQLGSVLHSDGSVRVTAQLVDAASDKHLWADDYERDLRDVLALQGEIAAGSWAPSRTHSRGRERLARARASC